MNGQYLGLSPSEASDAALELFELIRMPFKTIKDYDSVSISSRSNYIQFWQMMNDFKSPENFNFKALSKLAMRLYSIPPSEAGAERKLSKLKWRFPDRRNRISEASLMNEIYIEEAYSQKLKSNKEFTKTIWELPQHNNNDS